MKTTVFSVLTLVTFLLFSCGQSAEEKAKTKTKQLPTGHAQIDTARVDTSNLKASASIYHLNIYCKNNAATFELNAIYNGSKIHILDRIGYAAITSQQNYTLNLPSNILDMVEIMPNVELFKDRNGAGTPTRGPWVINFDISCIGDDFSMEKKVTPRYEIQAMNYFDYLDNQNDECQPLRIYLKNNCQLADVQNLLNLNSDEYNKFKSHPRPVPHPGRCN